jgi:hypothetical protein
VHLYSHILGKHIVDKLQARLSAPVLVIGSDTFSRPQLGKIGCFNFQAATRISHLLTNELKVKDTKDLFLNVPPGRLAIPGLGAICLATIGAAFEAKRLGTLEDYVSRHMATGEYYITFNTLKANAADALAARQEKRDKRDRRNQRRDKAHAIRVDRHMTRAAQAAAP